MKNIFSIRQFASAQSGEPSYSDISPEEYLRTMLSCIRDDVLLIARATDDVSIYLADDFPAADYVEKYQIDSSKVDEADLVRKEQAIFCGVHGDRREKVRSGDGACCHAVGCRKLCR